MPIGQHAEPPASEGSGRDLFYRELRVSPGICMRVRVSAQMGVMTETPDSPLLRKPQCPLTITASEVLTVREDCQHTRFPAERLFRRRIKD